MVGQPNVYSCTVFHSLKLPSKLLQTALALLPPTVGFLLLSVHAPGQHDRLLSTTSVPSKDPLSLDVTFPACFPGPSSSCSKHVYNHTCVHLRATDPSLETENDAWR